MKKKKFFGKIGHRKAIAVIFALLPTFVMTSFCFSLVGQGAEKPPPDGHTEIRPEGGCFQIFHNDEPYFIKGIGGRHYLGLAKEAGANSIRTWSPKNAEYIMERAQELGMAVMLGLELSNNAEDYDDAYRAEKLDEINGLVDKYCRHPALLIWGLGNEINLNHEDTPEIWRFVNALAASIKERDPYHPVVSVIAFDKDAFDKIAEYAPNLDAVGVNAYGALPELRLTIEASKYKGPYIVTEWGTDGHWEVDQTPWGYPVEPTSAEKARQYLERYHDDILANQDRCLGSYAFLWGQKQERTPTWYSLLLKDGKNVFDPVKISPMVGVMRFNWSGKWFDNRAPRVEAVTINGVTATHEVFRPREVFTAKVMGEDWQEGRFVFVWEMMEEPDPDQLGVGGSPESKPETVIKILDGRTPQLSLAAPEKTGNYRLFVYVLSGNRVGTANIPFRVERKDVVGTKWSDQTGKLPTLRVAEQ